MPKSRKIEIFRAGCAACAVTVAEIRERACPSCEVVVLDMKDEKVAERAGGLGIRSVPAVLIDGKLAACCAGRDPGLAALESAGLGQPLA